MAHFDLPLDIPHAGRIADRLRTLLERHVEDTDIDGTAAVGTAEKIWTLLFRFTGEDDNPADAARIRDEAAALGRQLVDDMERAGIAGCSSSCVVGRSSGSATNDERRTKNRRNR